jgi:hypothetical protein
MKRLLLVLVAAALLLPAAARTAGCSPLNCGPSQFTLAHGTLLGYRASSHAPVSVVDLRTGDGVATLPWGFVYGNVLVHQQGRRVEWYDATTGRKTAQRALPWKIRLAGASQDGRRAIAFVSKSAVAVVSASSWRRVPLATGNWDFDALSGHDLYLIRYLAGGGYQIRLVDLSNDSVPSRVVKDPHESGTIWGQPFSRLTSADGRYVFTTYIAPNGAAMIHELDLATRKARCIDLPGTGDYGSAITWGLALAPDRRTLWAVSPGYGRVVAIDAVSRKTVDAFRISFPYWNVGSNTEAAISPDGTQLAVANGEEVARIDLHTRKLTARAKQRAVAVAYAPDSGELRTLP